MFSKKMMMISSLVLLLALSGLVSAEDGTGAAGVAMTTSLTAAQKEELMAKWHAQIEKNKESFKTKLVANIASKTKLGGMEIQGKVLEKIEARRGEIVEKLAERREKVATNMEDRWAVRELEGNAKLLERLRLAATAAADAELEGADELMTLYERLKVKTTLTVAEKKEIEDHIRAFRKAHLGTFATRLIANAEEISTKLGSILTRLEAKIDELDAQTPGSVERLEATHAKLVRLKAQLDERIVDAKAKQAAFVQTDEQGNTNHLRASLHRLRAWSGISVHAMMRLVWMVNHVQNHPTDVDVDTLTELEVEVPTLAEAEAEVEAEVQAEFALNEMEAPEDEVSIGAPADATTPTDTDADDSTPTDTGNTNEAEVEVSVEGGIQ